MHLCAPRSTMVTRPGVGTGGMASFLESPAEAATAAKHAAIRPTNMNISFLSYTVLLNRMRSHQYSNSYLPFRAPFHGRHLYRVPGRRQRWRIGKIQVAKRFYGHAVIKGRVATMSTRFETSDSRWPTSWTPSRRPVGRSPVRRMRSSFASG